MTWEYGGRDYPTIPAPEAMSWCTDWPLPAPEVVQKALRTPLRGLWIDHVPTGPEIVAMGILQVQTPDEAMHDILATGDWEHFGYPAWLGNHPEIQSPQMVMPDEWFDHPEAKRPPPAFDPSHTPKSGEAVRLIAATALCGHGSKRDAETLPALWRRGLLRTARERRLASTVLRHAKQSYSTWHRMILDEGWTMRRAAQILREAGCWIGPICAWTNQWALPPPGTPPARSAPEESPAEIIERCRSQTADDGPWPLSRTEEIAAAHDYRRVE